MELRLRYLRKKANVSLEKVSNYLGITKQAVLRWEKGQNEITVDNLIKLADYFGVTVDFILYHGASKKANFLTKDEAALIDDLRSLTKKDKDFVFDMVANLGKVRKRKK